MSAAIFAAVLYSVLAVFIEPSLLYERAFCLSVQRGAGLTSNRSKWTPLDVYQGTNDLEVFDSPA
jgi:leucyl-tRNA synthetase